METTTIKIPGMDDVFVQEAIKTFRTNLQFCGQDIQVICLTSCDENEGKSTISLHVAKSFSDLGKRVLLIDTDMRKSVLAGKNTTARHPVGLSELLTGMISLKDCLYSTQFPGLDLLFAGKYPPNPVELLSGRYFTALIEEVRKVYDYIIVDTPPLGRVIDAAVVAPKCDGTVLVLGNQRTSRRHAQEVINQIEKSGAHLLGVVRNNAHKKSGYYAKNMYSAY